MGGQKQRIQDRPDRYQMALKRAAAEFAGVIGNYYCWISNLACLRPTYGISHLVRQSMYVCQSMELSYLLQESQYHQIMSPRSCFRLRTYLPSDGGIQLSKEKQISTTAASRSHGLN